MIDDNQNITSKQETLLAQKELSDIDFLENDANQIQIEYADEELRVYRIETTQQESQKEELLRVPLKLTDYVKLDNGGSAYLGFTHETQNLSNTMTLENWSFISEARCGAS